MNDWDRGNLNFIMSADEETLEDFLSWASDDDIKYAFELIQMAKQELDVQTLEWIDNIAQEDLSLAQEVLKKFRL